MPSVPTAGNDSPPVATTSRSASMADPSAHRHRHRPSSSCRTSSTLESYRTETPRLSAPATRRSRTSRELFEVGKYLLVSCSSDSGSPTYHAASHTSQTQYYSPPVSTLYAASLGVVFTDYTATALDVLLRSVAYGLRRTLWRALCGTPTWSGACSHSLASSSDHVRNTLRTWLSEPLLKKSRSICTSAGSTLLHVA